MAAVLTLDLVRHMKARNRDKWTEPDEERPLSKLGFRQAEMHAAVMAEGDDIVAVYSSPALRCRQTVEPLARLLGVEVTSEPLLAEAPGQVPIGAESPLLEALRERHPDGGRIVACGHADTIPAFLASLEGETEAAIPGLLKGFGGWYRVTVAEGSRRVERVERPAGFPVERD